MILIVDADTVSASSLARLLRYNGHPAEVVPSPTEALALLPTRKPAAIVLDLTLPHISGLHLIKAIRTDRAFDDVPLLVYTGNFSHADADEARRAGAADVIVKGTVGTQSLLARIEKHLPDADPKQDPSP
jgi:two-component system cell cycle response regulator DivK